MPSIIAVHLEIPLSFRWKSYHFQVTLSEKMSILETAEQKIAELTAKSNEQQKLIQKLEDDILKVWNDYLGCLCYISTTLNRIRIALFC